MSATSLPPGFQSWRRRPMISTGARRARMTAKRGFGGLLEKSRDITAARLKLAKSHMALRVR